MKKSLVAIGLTLVSYVAVSQQDAQFSQNMFNKLAINPAYAGTNKALCATLLGRSQWIQFPGAPKTYLLSVDGYFPIIHGGAGLTVVQDELGFDRTFMAKGAYSFHWPIGPGTLAVGAEVGMISKVLKGDWIAPNGTSTAAGNVNQDPAIPTNNGLNAITYDVGFGAYYTTNQLYFGISSTHLPKQALETKDGLSKIKFEMARHYYILAGYSYALTPTWDLKPSIFVKSDAASTQLDANLLVEYNKLIWAGVSYRITDAIVAMVGAQKQIGKGIGKFGFAYDVTTSDIKNYSHNTIELMLGYCINIIPPEKKQSHQNVRFL